MGGVRFSGGKNSVLYLFSFSLLIVNIGSSVPDFSEWPEDDIIVFSEFSFCIINNTEFSIIF